MSAVPRTAKQLCAEVTARVNTRFELLRGELLSRGTLDALDTSDLAAPATEAASTPTEGGPTTPSPSEGERPTPPVTETIPAEVRAMMEAQGLPPELLARMEQDIARVKGRMRVGLIQSARSGREKIDCALKALKCAIWDLEGATLALEEMQNVSAPAIDQLGAFVAVQLAQEQLERATESTKEFITAVRRTIMRTRQMEEQGGPKVGFLGMGMGPADEDPESPLDE